MHQTGVKQSERETRDVEANAQAIVIGCWISEHRWRCPWLLRQTRTPKKIQRKRELTLSGLSQIVTGGRCLDSPPPNQEKEKKLTDTCHFDQQVPAHRREGVWWWALQRALESSANKDR